MKRMWIDFILGCVLVAIGILMISGKFNPGNDTRHFKVTAEINDKTVNRLTFSIVGGEPLTIDFLKNKFNYNSNDKMVITDIKVISMEEKLELLKKD